MRGHGIAVIEGSHLRWIEGDSTAISSVELDGDLPIFELYDVPQVAIIDSKVFVPGGELDAVAYRKLACNFLVDIHAFEPPWAIGDCLAVLTKDGEGIVAAIGRDNRCHAVACDLERLAAGIRLDLNQSAAQDVTLIVGQVQQTVTVDADVSGLNTVTSELSNEVTGTQLRDLPLKSRNPFSLVELAPGFSGSIGDDYNSVSISVDGGLNGYWLPSCQDLRVDLYLSGQWSEPASVQHRCEQRGAAHRLLLRCTAVNGSSWRRCDRLWAIRIGCRWNGRAVWLPRAEYLGEYA